MNKFQKFLKVALAFTLFPLVVALSIYSLEQQGFFKIDKIELRVNALNSQKNFISPKVKDLQEKLNLTYLFISHDLAVVKYMADQMVVMNHGKIVEKGEADAVYEHPQNEYTQKLISAIPKGI